MTAASSSTPTSSNAASVPLCSIARMHSSPVTTRARRTGPASPRSSKPANCTASIRKPTSPTCSPSSSISGPPRASTSSCPGPGRPSDRSTVSPPNPDAHSPHSKSSHQTRGAKRPLTSKRVPVRLIEIRGASHTTVRTGPYTAVRRIVRWAGPWHARHQWQSSIAKLKSVTPSQLMMCRLVVGERAHQRPKQKAERPNDPQPVCRNRAAGADRDRGQWQRSGKR